MNELDLNFDKPGILDTAIRLGYAALIIAIVNILIHVSTNGIAQKGAIVNIVSNIVVFVGISNLLYQITKGKSWARIVLLILFILSLSSVYFYFKPGSEIALAEKLVYAIGKVLELISVILMFRKESNAWFAIKAIHKSISRTNDLETR